MATLDPQTHKVITKSQAAKSKSQSKELKKALLSPAPGMFGVRWPRWLKIATIALIGLLVSTIIGTAVLFIWYSKDLPSPSKLRDLKEAESTKIYDRNGETLYEIHGEEDRTLIEYKDMPEYIKDATVALEDHDFYKHKGFALRSIFRALETNILHQGTVEGGSTITQQLVKNAILSPERTFQRKIQELILAIEIEQIYSKEDILKMYLNEIPYGNNAYGVESAANIYFGKHAKDLTLAESALLAALPKAPTYYDPYGSNVQETLLRKNDVLDRMVKYGFIKKEAAETAKKQELTFQARRFDIKAPHFVMYVRQLLVEKYGEKMLQEGGLRVTTSLDLKVQNIVQEEITAGAERNWDAYGGYNMAGSVIDPKTGQILAMVGSRDYFDTEHDGNVNVATAIRSPGSSFKPYVYAIGFSKKYGASSPLYDVKTNFGYGYSPDNFTHATYGLMSARTALANSLNIPAVKMTALDGVDEVIKYGKELGFTTMKDPSQISYSIGIGGNEVKLIEHVSAMGTFATAGIHHELTPFLKITDSKGKVLEEYRDSQKKVFEPSVAYIISNILSDNNARGMIFGTNTALAPGDRIFAAKTGTSEEFKDAWTVGYTPNLALGVWAGNNDGSLMSNSGDGILAAAPVWRIIFDRVTEAMNLPVEDFQRPDGVEDVTVDAYTGLLPGNGTSKTFTDLWASFAKPTEKSNVYSKYKVCKINGKLATGVEPPDAVEERTFANIKSEMPDNEDWNKPVQAWLAGAGFGPPPKEKCDDVYKESNRPKISITSPANGASVASPIKVTVSSSAPNGVSAIQIFVDGAKVAEGTGNSYTIKTSLSGSHKISAKVIDKAFLSAEAAVTVTITGSGPTLPPTEEPPTEGPTEAPPTEIPPTEVPPPTDTPGP